MPQPTLRALLAACPVWDGLDGGTLLIACSGGADSVGLALAAHELLQDPQFSARFTTPPQLALWHFNHHFRDDSDADEQFVRDLAQQLGVSFLHAEAPLEQSVPQLRTGLEALGRRLRYAALSVALDSTALPAPRRACTAHHLGDQAETILHHIVRGTGLLGLRGIAPVLLDAVFRPWLQLAPEEIRAYLQARQQVWREDASNADTTLTRNRLRHDVLPLLCDINARSREHLAEVARSAAEAELVLLERLRPEEDTWLAGHNLAGLLPVLAGPEKYWVVWSALPWAAGGLLPLQAFHMLKQRSKIPRDLAAQLAVWQLDPSVPLQAGSIRLTLLDEHALECRDTSVPLHKLPDLQLQLSLQHTRHLRVLLSQVTFDSAQATAWIASKSRPRMRAWTAWLAALVNEAVTTRWDCLLPADVPLPLVLRCWHTGERIELAGGGSKTLGDVFTDAQIPLPFRQVWAVLADAQDKVLWVPGLADSEAMGRVKTEGAALLVELRVSE